jgi:uncharacterized membrane protein YphA (DoxX/SURF4 family)
MNIAALGSRYLLGLVYLVFGLNGFLNFIPIPPPTPEGGAFLGALAATGYMFPIIKSIEIVGGALLLAGFAFPLAQILLAPITINIFLYHLILDGSINGMALPMVLVICQLIMGYVHFNRFKPLFAKA